MKFVLCIFVLSVLDKYSIGVYYDIRNDYLEKDAGEPLFLTDYIEKGLITEAQKKARVWYPALEGMESYTGFITINKTYNSNTFFWFFPSQTNPQKDPVIVWLIGGPGLTNLIAIFTHNGPLVFETANIIKTRNHTLTKHHSVIYVENPIGSGFSFTENDKGYARIQMDIAQDVTAFLAQFFQLFPEYRKNDFYVTGDSFGGKFVITVGNHIRNLINQNKSDINFKGIALGNGLIDLEHQGIHSDFLYTIGFVDERGRSLLKDYELSGKIRQRDEMDILLPNITGYTYYSNFLVHEFTFDESYINWVDSPSVRRALHVGNLVLNATSDVVRSYLETATENPVTTWIEEILRDNYRVLVYNGQLDMIFPYTSSQNLYEKFKWRCADDYIKATRSQWWVDGELAGYVKAAGYFYEVFVRDAGHITFMTQPKWSAELIKRFTHRKPIGRSVYNSCALN